MGNNTIRDSPYKLRQEKQANVKQKCAFVGNCIFVHTPETTVEFDLRICQPWTCMHFHACDTTSKINILLTEY